MKIILFCNLPYSFSILKPLEEEIIKRNFEYIWYISSSIVNLFPYKDNNYTSDINTIKEFNSDAIFVPGNDIPHFLQGIKVQIFHGLAGEKKGHFRIRDYFDLYLTQGPYFTNKFKELSNKHKNFQVKETGWCKLDKLYTISEDTNKQKLSLLKEYNAKHIILYSPTFSPSLTSGIKLLNTIEQLSNNDDILVIIKFHDKMDNEIKEQYKQIKSKNLIISDIKDITPLLQTADLMISDTSSVVYEFALLDKPVVTLNSISEHINWLDLDNEDNMLTEVLNTLESDNYKTKRQNTIALYHPYNDGQSASRMVDAVIEYKEEYGVPKKRKLSLLRKLKIYNKYGI
ncbi:MAG: CDP-glycerol--glycerophosphate glycerophosphotransferase [Epsilonproteobacteria bacterium]|nr:MAG: CDP-glycerol--glycerophosphate glycerophosphotransferase [Campylobacterota bacterium]